MEEQLNEVTAGAGVGTDGGLFAFGVKKQLVRQGKTVG